MPASLLFALLCSYGVAFLIGLFVGTTAPQRRKARNIKDYRRFYEEEMEEAQNDSWNHPAF